MREDGVHRKYRFPLRYLPKVLRAADTDTEAEAEAGGTEAWAWSWAWAWDASTPIARRTPSMRRDGKDGM